MSGGSDHGGAAGRGGSAGAGRTRRLRGIRRSALSSSRPRFILLGVWIVYPASTRSSAASSGRAGSALRRDRQLQGALLDLDARSDGDQEQRDLGAVVPALVTAIGLDLRRADRAGLLAVAFKTVVFMPMAISVFAAGVIWRIMDQQDPTAARSTQSSQVVARSTSTAPGVAVQTRIPSTGRAGRSTTHGARAEDAPASGRCRRCSA